MRRRNVIWVMVTTALLVAGPAVLASPHVGTVAPASDTSALTRSDFDQDGYEDVAIGVPLDGVAGKADAGLVHVLYGSATGLGSARSQLITQDSAGVADVAEVGDRFGQSIAAGDFNGDGYADLAIGVPREDLGGVTNQGGVNVVFGSASGLEGDPDQPLIFGSAKAAYADAEIGFALAVLDRIIEATGVQGFDGLPDLLVGMPGYGGHGDAFLLSTGRLDGVPGGGHTLQLDFPAVTQGARLGSVVAAGDLSGSARWEMLVGAPQADVTGPDGRPILGAGLVMVDSIGGFAALTEGDELGLGKAEPGDAFGSAITTGRIDGDAFEDVLIGVPGEDLGGQRDAGQIHVYRSVGGGRSGSRFLLNEDSEGVPGARRAGDRFGTALAIGEFEGAGGPDVAIGAPGALAGGVPAGAVVILSMDGPDFGTGDFFTSRLTQPDAGPDSAESGDAFGAALYLANVTGDGGGFETLSVGSPGEDIAGVSNAGAIDTFVGGYEGAVGGETFLHQETSMIADTAQVNDRFGGVLP